MREPVEVTLASYFMSKYELTQAQWLRLAKKRKSSKHGPPKSNGRKHEIFGSKRGSEKPFSQVKKSTARSANRPSGHSAKKK